MEKILVGMDASAITLWAPIHAINLGKRIKAKIYILLVINPGMAPTQPDFQEEMEEESGSLRFKPDRRSLNLGHSGPLSTGQRRFQNGHSPADRWSDRRYLIDGVFIIEETYQYRLLRRVVKKISPLNLVDPYDKNFNPTSCKTFHEISRLVHKKAVEELIELKYDHRSETALGESEEFAQACVLTGEETLKDGGSLPSRKPRRGILSTNSLKGSGKI